jgi:VTC domain
MSISKENIAAILGNYKTISLEEMDGVKLMDRTDKKFVFNRGRLDSLLTELQHDYLLLQINGVVFNRYETLYFDTHEFNLYHEHHRGKSSRYKVRARKYVDSNLNYFEVKFKNNKGRTIKNRIKLKEIENEIGAESSSFLKSVSPLNANNLHAKLWSNCTRITLVNKESKERLTIDIDLHFKNEKEEINLPNIVIAEVKQEKSSGSAFVDLMKKERIKEGSISKYCIAVVSLFNEVKKNNFKQKLITLNKINHDV